MTKAVPVFSERDFARRALELSPENVAQMKSKYIGAFPSAPGGDALSDVLGSRLRSAYANQIQSVKDKFYRQAPLDVVQLQQPAMGSIAQKYQETLRREAEEKAREMAKKAKRKQQLATAASLAGMVIGGPALAGGAAGAMIGGGAGGLIGGM